LVPAYAATIHKSQGSEYPAVVIPILTQLSGRIVGVGEARSDSGPVCAMVTTNVQVGHGIVV
jgi:hypothetical protein